MRIIKLLFLAMFVGTWCESGVVAKKPKNKIVVLAGTSYAGKTSTREWLMMNSNYGFIWMGLDAGVAGISKITHIGSGAYKNYERYHDIKIDESGNLIWAWPERNAKDEKGIAFNSLAYAIPHAIFNILVKQGYHNIILDDSFGAKGDDSAYLQCVNPEQFDVYVFKLRITEETAKARSGGRDGAQIPYYESKIGAWDLAIDTDDMTIEEIGQTILDYIENNEPRAINEEPLSTYYKPNLLLIA